VLIAVVSVTLAVLAAFDLAAVKALHDYLLGRTDTTLFKTALIYRSRLSTVQPAVRRDFYTQPPKSVYTLPYGSKTLDQVLAPVNYYLSVVGGQETVLYGPSLGHLVAMEFRSTVRSTIPKDLHTLVVGGGAQTAPSFDGKGQVRAIATRAPSGILTVSTRLDDVNHTMGRMWLIVLTGSAAALLFISFGVFWLLWRGLRPIETMAAQADRITAGDLTDRVAAQDPRSEVGRLGSALNGMLARIEASVQEREAGQELMRRFFADASHELRTPLASLRANAELYQQGALPERAQVDEVMRRIALESRRMSGLVDDMLRLARLDQHPDQQREPVELTGLVASCVDRMRVAAPGHGWRTEIAAGVVVVGDEELLRRAVDNLLANVLAHTPEGTSATVALRAHGDAVEIEVSDTGPGVPPDRLPRIFDRFYRADTTTPRPGSGLGLAIVTQIATVHHGTVVAEPNSPHGLRVRLTLPVPGLGRFTQDSHDSAAGV
jgi:two-component system OmpR family sensor kinase